MRDNAQTWMVAKENLAAEHEHGETPHTGRQNGPAGEWVRQALPKVTLVQTGEKMDMMEQQHEQQSRGHRRELMGHYGSTQQNRGGLAGEPSQALNNAAQRVPWRAVVGIGSRESRQAGGAPI